MTEHQPPNPQRGNRRTSERRGLSNIRRAAADGARAALADYALNGYSVEFIPAERRMQNRRARVWAPS